MAVKTQKQSIGKVGDDYLKLITAYPLRPIRSEVEHREAKKALRNLSTDASDSATDYKIVLASLIATYERDAGLRLDTSDIMPADLVRHLLAERNMSVNAFAKDRGLSQSALSDMLSGKREWSRATIISVADYFGLPRGLFLQ